MAKLNQIIPGAVFRHYKGQEYKIVTLAKNESNEEDVVVYEALYGDHRIWVRRLESFCDDSPLMMWGGRDFPSNKVKLV